MYTVIVETVVNIIWEKCFIQKKICSYNLQGKEEEYITVEQKDKNRKD